MIKKPTIFPPFNQQKVLLVDDNLVTILLAKKMLNNWNLNVDVATNGLEAVRKVLITSYDILLMDLNMPELKGAEASKFIRRMGNQFDKLPILAFSALDVSVIEESVYEGSMNSFISKPYAPQQLYDELKKFLY